MDLPEIRTDFANRPPEAHTEPPAQAGARGPVQAPPRGPRTPRLGGHADTGGRMAPGRIAGWTPEVTGTARASAFADEYALPLRTEGYVSTDDSGIFETADSGQKVVFQGGRTFTVCRDPNEGTWRLVRPQGPDRFGPRIRLNAGGEWEACDARRPRTTDHASGAVRSHDGIGGPGALPPWILPVAPTDRVAEFLLRFPACSVSTVARTLGVPDRATSAIAADVDAAVRAWRELRQTGTHIRPSVIVAPLTERERQYVQKWCGVLSSARLAALMRTPETVIDAFLSATARTGGAPTTDSSLPERDALSSGALTDWLETADADIVDGRREARFSISPAAAAFVQQWKGRLSARNIATLMTLPDEVIDTHSGRAGPASASLPALLQALAEPPALRRRHSPEFRPAGRFAAQPTQRVPPLQRPPASPARVSRPAQPEPPAGPSGYWEPMSDAERAQAIDLNRRGMSPSTIAMYVGKPSATVEAFLRERPR
jgi:hypothetical protein